MSVKEIKEEELEQYKNESGAMFWYYYRLGDKRSLHRVALKFKVKDWVVKELSGKNKWAEKVVETDEASDSNVLENKLMNYVDFKQFDVITKILDDPSAKSTEKLRAVEMLNELAKRSTEIKNTKKIAIEFNDEEKLKEIVKTLNERRIIGDKFEEPIEIDEPDILEVEKEI